MRNWKGRLFIFLLLASLALLPVFGGKPNKNPGGGKPGGDTPVEPAYAKLQFGDGANIVAAELNTLRLWTEDASVSDPWVQEGTNSLDIVLADVDGCGTPEIIVATTCIYDDDQNPDTPGIYYHYVDAYKEGADRGDGTGNPRRVWLSTYYLQTYDFTHAVEQRDSATRPNVAAGEFDGTPGDEIVLMTRTKVAMIDYVTDQSEALVKVWEQDVSGDPADAWSEGFTKAVTASDIDGDELDEVIVAVNKWNDYSTMDYIIPSLWIVPDPATGVTAATTETFVLDETNGYVKGAGFVDHISVAQVGGAPLIVANVDTGQVWGWRYSAASTGTEASILSVLTGDVAGSIYFKMAAGNIDADSDDEVVVHTSGPRTRVGKSWVFPEVLRAYDLEASGDSVSFSQIGEDFVVPTLPVLQWVKVAEVNQAYTGMEIIIGGDDPSRVMPYLNEYLGIATINGVGGWQMLFEGNGPEGSKVSLDGEVWVKPWKRIRLSPDLPE